MKKILLTLPSVPAALMVSAGNKNYLRYMDPYTGAWMPLGTVQIGLQNIFKGWSWSSGCNYSDNVLIGFLHTHLSGIGCNDLGDIRLMPFTGEACTFYGEQVSSYFYTLIPDNGIYADNDAELATGSWMKIYTDRPGFRFCAGQGMDGKEIGKRGNRHNFRSGVALETHYFPDVPP